MNNANGSVPVANSLIKNPLLQDRLIRVTSRQDLWEQSVNIIKNTKYIVEHAKNVKMVLGTSKGRDKLCSIIQYVAKFVYTCNIHSNIKEYQETLKNFGESRDDRLLSARIYKSMSKNRKIFNLFKFIDEIYYIMNIAKSSTNSIEMKFFDIMSHFCAFLNFALDNLVWMINTRILSHEKLVQLRPELSYYRYTSALWRTLFNFVFSIMELRWCQKYFLPNTKENK